MPENGGQMHCQILCLVRQKNSHAIISELKDNYGSRFTRKEDLEEICLNFYQKLYGYREILGEAMQEVLDGLPAMFTGDMNVILTKQLRRRNYQLLSYLWLRGRCRGMMTYQ